MPTSSLAPTISIVVPVYNEIASLPMLIQRVHNTLSPLGKPYEFVFIDDHSNDGSFEYLSTLSESLTPFGVKLARKHGKRGKGYSLMQGFSLAAGETIAMIDADLQYAPEAIPEMLKSLENSDIVVGERQYKTMGTRERLSRVYRNIVGKGLFGLPIDIQSGLKVFRREVIQSLSFTPTAWGFDYHFLYLSKRMHWRITQVPITFSERTGGESKINVVKSGFQLLFGAIVLRARFIGRDIFSFLDWPHHSEKKALNYENTEDYLFLPEIYSTKRHIYKENVSGGIVLAILSAGTVIGISLLIHQSIPVVISGIIAAFYLGLFVFKLYVVHIAIDRPGIDYTKEQIASITDAELPMYSILIPLYQEAEVIPQIIAAMNQIDYPKDKIDLIITLEEYDHETINAIAAANPPAYFKTLILPDVKPKTKPKALNVAFPHLKGEFMVIYDAEIVPDPDQLKKAYLAFREHLDVACLQTQLDHYNARETWVTKLFNAEFSFYYDMFLPGLQKLGVPIPLSGHSSHYRVDVIRELGAWDPYNVTEDCELGMRMYRKGYKTDILNSNSVEEATSTASAWIGQRTRWIKGFIQTTLVHMRHPLRFKDELGGWGRLLGFLFVVPGSVAVNILNLVYWVLLIAWLTTHSTAIQAFFPGAILYTSVFCFIAGNFAFTYLNLVGAYRRGRFDLVKYSLLSPVYWLMLAYATVKASIEIIYKPHHWSKTKHGVHKHTPTPAPASALTSEEYVLPAA